MILEDYFLLGHRRRGADEIVLRLEKKNPDAGSQNAVELLEWQVCPLFDSF